MTPGASDGGLPLSSRPDDDDVAFYAEHGWWISPKVLSDDFIDAAVDAAERFCRGRDRTLPFEDEYCLRTCLSSLAAAAAGLRLGPTVGVNNASRDGSATQLPGPPDVVLIENSTNVGFAAACNQGRAWDQRRTCCSSTPTPCCCLTRCDRPSLSWTAQSAHLTASVGVWSCNPTAGPRSPHRAFPRWQM